jgi:hypothetical protein
MASAALWSEFRHYSPAEIQTVNDSRQIKHFKPKGIYFSRGTAWLDWTVDEGYSPNTYIYIYELDPQTPPLNILRLDLNTAAAFVAKYEAPDDGMSLFHSVDWSRVATEYDGVYIVPELVHSGRHHHLWSSYDVETLVIWSHKLKVRFVDYPVYPVYPD